MSLESDILYPFTLTVKRNLLKYAAGRAMFCPQCGDILDCRRAVLTTGRTTGRERIFCATCYDKLTAQMAPGAVQRLFLEVLDGRIIFARPKRQRKPGEAPKLHRMRIPTGVGRQYHRVPVLCTTAQKAAITRAVVALFEL